MEYTVNLHLARETKHTLRYESDDEYLPVIYIQKTRFNGEKPPQISVTLTWYSER